MVDEKEKNVEISETVKNNIENFQLFTLSNDKHTQNIFEISNPYEFLLPQYLEQAESGNLSKLFSLDGLNLLKIVSPSINLKELFLSDKTGFIYQPDFESLSRDTKEKIKTGIYKIGNSKKVEGNMRAVIVDATNSNQRVEDLTFKEVAINKGVSGSLSDLAVQAQLKQIYEIVLDIQGTQEYQINWDRNNSILPSFFTARTEMSASSRIEQLTPINFEHFRSQTCSDDVSFGS